MKWKDHVRITKLACHVCGLPEDACNAVAEASVLPDRHPDRDFNGKRIPHHSLDGLEKGIDHLKNARKAYVKGKDFTTCLGKALHYVQDFCVSNWSEVFVFSYRDEEKHDAIERAASKLPLPVSLAKSALSEVVYPHAFKEFVTSRAPLSEAEKVLETAVYLSTIAVKLVVNPDFPPNLAEDFFARRKINYRVSLASFVVATSLALSHFSLLPSVVAGLLTSYVVHELDPEYSKLRYDWNWLHGT